MAGPMALLRPMVQPPKREEEEADADSRRTVEVATVDDIAVWVVGCGSVDWARLGCLLLAALSVALPAVCSLACLLVAWLERSSSTTLL